MARRALSDGDREAWAAYARRVAALPGHDLPALAPETATAAAIPPQPLVIARPVRVEVITGRGSGEQGGVIRRELPLWLNLPQLRPLVLAVTHPHAANVGSVRLLLRKSR